MLPKPRTCCGCPLYEKGTGFSRPDGTGKNHVLLVGEALGHNEAMTGVPFVGEAGAQLNRTLARTRQSRYDFKIWNVIACQPPNNWLDGAPWETAAIKHCRQYLDDVIEKMNPLVVVPLGNVALKALLGIDGILDRRAPKRGYVYDMGNRWAVPSMHPSFVMQGSQNLTGVQAHDITKAVNVALHGYAEPPYEYLSVADAEKFAFEAEQAVAQGAWMTADIETEYSQDRPEDEPDKESTQITRISFAFKPHQAITLRWEEENIHMIQRLLLLKAQRLVFWNADFDVPRLKAAGMKLPEDRILDAMWMWHYLQSDLPKGLGFVATFFTELQEWKSLSERSPEFYSCRDSDAAIQCAYGIRDLLLKEKRFHIFLQHWVRLDPVLKEMGRSGVLIDKEQKEKFRKEMNDEKERLDQQVQQAVPPDLRPFKVRRKVPPDAVLGSPVRLTGGEAVWDCDANGEWGERSPFSVGSSKQVIAYMRLQGHPVPRNYKTGRDTSSADEIERLAKRYPKDPLYKVIVAKREADKIISQYLNGYEPDADGRIRTTFTQKPSTLRLASQDPNVQNIRKRWEQANEYRKMFVPTPGHVLAEFDHRAIEAVITGYLAGDEDYVRYAKLGVHAILASHAMGKPINVNLPTVSAEISALKKSDKKMYDMAKTIVHMSNYGGTPRRIMMDNPEQFRTTKEALDLQELYFNTIGRRIRQWQNSTLSQAHQRGFLENPFGYRHYFYDVIAWDDSWGTDAKRALAFLPQSTAAAVVKESILRFSDRSFYRKAIRWQIHDSLIFELPNDRLLDTRMAAIKREMEAPISQLGGLTIEVEASLSDRSWGEMTEWHQGTSVSG